MTAAQAEGIVPEVFHGTGVCGAFTTELRRLPLTAGGEFDPARSSYWSVEHTQYTSSGVMFYTVNHNDSPVAEVRLGASGDWISTRPSKPIPPSVLVELPERAAALLRVAEIRAGGQS